MYYMMKAKLARTEFSMFVVDCLSNGVVQLALAFDNS